MLIHSILFDHNCDSTSVCNIIFYLGGITVAPNMYSFSTQLLYKGAFTACPLTMPSTNAFAVLWPRCHWMYPLLELIQQFPLFHQSHIKCSLLWRHNGRGSVSNHQPQDCLFNILFKRISKKTSKLTGEFPAQLASNAENVSIWWRHHVINPV